MGIHICYLPWLSSPPAPYYHHHHRRHHHHHHHHHHCHHHHHHHHFMMMVVVVVMMMMIIIIIIMRYHTLKGFCGLQFLGWASVLQFLTPVFLVSLFTTLVHLTLGLDAPLFPSGLQFAIIFYISQSLIMITCFADLSLTTYCKN